MGQKGVKGLSESEMLRRAEEARAKNPPREDEEVFDGTKLTTGRTIRDYHEGTNAGEAASVRPTIDFN